MTPSAEDKVLLIEFRLTVEFEFIVAVRPTYSPPIEIKASARSNTFPVNAALKDALCGVDGTVA